METLERKFGYKLNRDLTLDIRVLEDEFVSRFWSFIPNNISRVVIDTDSTSKQLDSLVEKSEYPVVSLDRVYITNADEYIEVTRVTDPKTGEVKIGERPLSEPLEKQINRLKKYDRVVLTDVGAFEGETLIEICNLIEKEDIDIEEIFLGFADNRANRKINKNRRMKVLNLFDFYEWLELRDLFGIDGRSVGTNKENRLYIPYWENLPKWASILDKYEQEVIELCKDYYKILTERLKSDDYNLEGLGTPVKYDGG